MRLKANQGGPNDTLADIATDAAAARRWVAGMFVAGLLGWFVLDVTFTSVVFGGALGLAIGQLGRTKKRLQEFEDRTS